MTAPDHRPYLLATELRTAEDVAAWLEEHAEQWRRDAVADPSVGARSVRLDYAGLRALQGAHADLRARLDRERRQAVDELERGIGQMRLIAGLPLPPDVAAKVAEADRLRKLFDDAGEGQYNVLNLVESYQRNSMEADERLRAVRKLLEWNGCECECSHHWEDHDDDCDRCLACRIGEAVGK